MISDENKPAIGRKKHSRLIRTGAWAALFAVVLLVPVTIMSCLPSGAARGGNDDAYRSSGNQGTSRGIVRVDSSGGNSRVALVIGNASYNVRPLRNPVNDAEAMSAALKHVGFTVIKRTNVNKAEMRAALREFASRLKQGGAGLFYYAGHGIQVDGENYLVPIGANVQHKFEMEDRCLKANYVMAAMEEAGNELNIVILDACRDNPFRTFRGGSQGLASMNAPTGTLAAFATSPGKVADDGIGRNSLYTTILLRHISTPGLDVRDMFNRVGNEVVAASHGTQVPWVSSTPLPPYFLVPSSSSPEPSPSVPAAPSSVARIDFGDLKQEAEAREKWSKWQESMEEAFSEADILDKDSRLAPGSKAKAWERVLNAYLDDNPYSSVDDSLRSQANSRIMHWEAMELEAERQRLEEERRRLADEKQRLAPGASIRPTGKSFTNSIGQKFVLIPAGSFIMGSPANEPDRKDDETQHRVTISKPYYMMTTEVTQGQWRAVMGSNPSKIKNCGDDCPVEQVSWDDAREFIRRLNAKEGTNRYRLPTEAEWEYAARAGSKTAYCFGDKISSLDSYAWYSDNFGYKTHPTQPVGQLKPNSWGLYDMHGNVWEWCQDIYSERAYDILPARDPIYKGQGSDRVLRGGSWFSFARSCRSADRGGNEPGCRSDLLGFRLAGNY